MKTCTGEICLSVCLFTWKSGLRITKLEWKRNSYVPLLGSLLRWLLSQMVNLNLGSMRFSWDSQESMGLRAWRSFAASPGMLPGSLDWSGTAVTGTCIHMGMWVPQVVSGSVTATKKRFNKVLWHWNDHSLPTSSFLAIGQRPFPYLFCHLSNDHHSITAGLVQEVNWLLYPWKFWNDQYRTVELTFFLYCSQEANMIVRL